MLGVTQRDFFGLGFRDIPISIYIYRYKHIYICIFLLASLDWFAVKELNSNYHNQENLLLSIYP